MASKIVLVIGANRGIGLNLVKLLSKRNWTVYGSVRPQTRTDESVKELQATGSRILEIDYLNEDTIAAAAKEFGPGPLDVLVNCGGVGPEPEDWQDHTKNILVEKFCVNAVGPFLAVKHFYPALKRSAAGKIINVSSKSASTVQNNGKDIGYRMAKAALNQQTVTLAREFEEAGDNIAVVAIYPGYVATRISSFRSKNDMDECMAGTVEVIETVNMAQSGMFLNWKNEVVPW